MKNILFPTDLSEASANTLNYAINFARYYNAELTAINVFQNNYGPRRPIIGEKQETVIAKNLRAFAKLHTEGDTYKSLHYRVRSGSTVSSIIKETKSQAYDLLILGKSPGYDWLTRILGSKTSLISRRAHCPVLMVPTGIAFNSINNVLIVGKSNARRKDILEDYLDKISSEQIMIKHDLISSTNKSDRGSSNRNDAQPISWLSDMMPFVFPKLKGRLEEKIHEMNGDLLVLNLDKSGLLLKEFGFRGWSQVVLSLKVPSLVVNNRFVNSDRVRKTFPLLLRDTKRMTRLNL